MVQDDKSYSPKIVILGIFTGLTSLEIGNIEFIYFNQSLVVSNIGFSIGAKKGNPNTDV